MNDVKQLQNNSLYTAELPVKFISPTEIKDIIRKLKIKESPGHVSFPVVMQNLIDQGK